MKKLTLFFSTALLLGTLACDVRKNDNLAPSDSKKTKLKKDNIQPTQVKIIDSVYDFGKVKEGDIVEYSYRFKNVGTQPLVIIDARASCGCTIPEKPEKPVAPGEMGFIKVKFNSENKSGVNHKTITVESNANPEFPILMLNGVVIGKEN